MPKRDAEKNRQSSVKWKTCLKFMSRLNSKYFSLLNRFVMIFKNVYDDTNEANVIKRGSQALSW